MVKDIDATQRKATLVDGEVQRTKVQTATFDRAEEIQVDGDQSRFSAMLGILRKLVGVSDIISLRLSLPSQLLDPIPNLEYWNYMDRPEYFVRIADSDDEVERILAVVAWWFSKLLKHSGKVLKPFNSILGEQFFSRWQVDTADNAARKGTLSTSSKNASSNGAYAGTNVTVEYITEQVSHHPPISAFVYRCPERGIELSGLDHFCAKFTGLSATVASGSECKGVFLNIKGRGEEYMSTHPTANIVGWLRGSLKVQFVDTSYVVCEKTKLAVIVEFKEERWFGKNKDNVSGRVFRFSPEQRNQIASWRLKDIPKSCDVVATFGGNWDKKVVVQRGGEESTLVDLTDLQVAEKIVRPVEEQGPMESRKVWGPVADKMNQGKFGEATKLKRSIEEDQRELAAERTAKGEPFVSALFKVESVASGKPELLSDAPINV
ncbi:hypothetical protein GGF37_003353 [Kickxella alabastrina]|nr:hypothetical protein GGF37_003353 [Kickxella alabastrina]